MFVMNKYVIDKVFEIKCLGDVFYKVDKEFENLFK